MQGLESLNQFQNFVSSLGGLGRFEDTYMIHAAEGETVVPMEVLNQNPILKERLFESMRDMGIQPERYIVGNELNSKNPVTGQPEFFLKKIGRRLRKAAADISGYAAPIVGAMYGPAAGAAAGAALGQYKRENPGDPNQALRMALLGGGSGLAANLASGQGLTPFGGMAEKYGYKPSEIWKGLGDIFTKGTKSNFLKGYTNPFTQDDSLLKKAWDSISSGGGSMTEKEILKGVMDGSIDADEAEVLLEKAGGGNKLLKGLLGIGGTLGLGKLIGEPEDITVDPSKIRTAPIDTGQVFSPTQPTTVYTDYNVPITPYQAADGGIMDLRGGGSSLGPGTETSDSIPAMLSDGEFVMTAKAVRGAGGGNRREGARKMYEAMDRLEARA